MTDLWGGGRLPRGPLSALKVFVTWGKEVVVGFGVHWFSFTVMKHHAKLTYRRVYLGLCFRGSESIMVRRHGTRKLGARIF